MKKRRTDEEIEYMIKESRERADRMIAAGRRNSFLIAKGIEQALEWTLGADNGFGAMVEALKAMDSNNPAMAEEIIAKAKAARAKFQ